MCFILLFGKLVSQKYSISRNLSAFTVNHAPLPSFSPNIIILVLLSPVSPASSPVQFGVRMAVFPFLNGRIHFEQQPIAFFTMKSNS